MLIFYLKYLSEVVVGKDWDSVRRDLAQAFDDLAVPTQFREDLPSHFVDTPQYLPTRGLPTATRRPCRGDGNCFFRYTFTPFTLDLCLSFVSRALAIALTGQDNDFDHYHLRSYAMQHLRNLYLNNELWRTWLDQHWDYREFYANMMEYMVFSFLLLIQSNNNKCIITIFFLRIT